MNEWALLRGGEVTTIITTHKTRDAVAEAHPGYEVKPLHEVPLATLRRYRYWSERP